MYGCSKEKQYTSILTYENLTNQEVKIIAYRDNNQKLEEWSLSIPSKKSVKTVITRYDSEDLFESIFFIKVIFEDKKSVVYDKLNNSYLNSDTNLFNLLNYKGTRESGHWKLLITDKHYQEASIKSLN